MSSNDYDKDVKYVYDLPYLLRTELCQILNQNDKWEELAGEMEYDVLTVQAFRRETNPADQLLEKWSHYNHTVLELFCLLSKMGHYQAMMRLKRFVNPTYHKLLDLGEGNLARFFPPRGAGTKPKDLKIDSTNFNNPKPSRPDVPKVVVDRDSDRSEKILNRQLQPPSPEQPSNSNNMLPSLMPTPFQKPVAGTLKKSSSLMADMVDTALPVATYEELARATNSWGKHTILGKGGFGTVFKGTWKNTQVAIKRIEQRGPDADESYLIQLQQSVRELKFLNSYRHDNILSLYAYSRDGDAPCLVYQYMPNGSLEDRILLRQNTKPLTWMQRHEIAKGTARGLQFLHTIGEKPLIHGDIKSANILLDKNLEPRIGDFGLAREGPEKDYMKVSRVHGTRPYLPDEFLRGRNLSTKVDTYSYGIVLFELATGLAAYDYSRPENKFLKDFMDSWQKEDLHLLIDKRAGEESKQVYYNLILIGKWCSNRRAMDRPEMEQVSQKLDQLG